MILDMNTELQHLISISMEKMTSGASSSMSGRGSRTADKMDLRKALLVAQFLQEVRQAYYDENYEIVAKSFSNNETGRDDDKYICEENEINKENKEKSKEGSISYYLDSDFSSMPTSTSAYPSCVTNADVMVSRISQITTPLSVSVNTSYVVCCQNLDQVSLKDTSVEPFLADDGDVPMFCDELEVSSCCEVSSDEEGVSNLEVDLHTHVTACNGNETSSDLVLTELESSGDASARPDNQNTRKVTKKSTDFTTLPKKKRPFPKEFLDETPSKSKSARTFSDAQTARHFQGCDITNTIITSATDTVTSKTSSATVCSVKESKTSFFKRTENLQPSPKVVVQFTQSCDTYQPITCSQLYLEKRLNELTAKSF